MPLKLFRCNFSQSDHAPFMLTENPSKIAYMLIVINFRSFYKLHAISSDSKIKSFPFACKIQIIFCSKTPL
ncbi:hypothetical protein HMPREF0239_02237 [Clostridium sp. ATCC BAA-442]|nr:hypothetical protein HMPREF0239_02237 [Clostridium sp. ATCC BAA-442]